MASLQVTCAIIYFDQRILAVQRSESMKLPLKWEFPGGKIESNESEEDCIKREIQEELNIEIELIKRLSTSSYDYPDFSIQLFPFIATHIRGEIVLKEHRQYLLLEKDELSQLDWAEADIAIVMELLRL